MVGNDLRNFTLCRLLIPALCAFGVAAIPQAGRAAGITAGVTALGPELGAASNFGQRWDPAILAAARRVPVRNFRDAVYWGEVEKTPGHFDFAGAETLYPDLLQRGGETMSLTVNWGNPLYDGGKTPYTPKAVAAFAHDAAVTVKRFPAIRAVEVGNEINSQNFVSGPVKEAGLDRRALYYLALLKATYRAVKAVDPAVRVLGGGVHSIPVGYLAPMFAAGAAQYMDALALHTYTTPAEQLHRQLALFRALPGAANLPLEVTEFGTPDAAAAPGYLLRNYCQMALSGVTRAVWYPLNPRGDGLAPLIDGRGQVTAVGQSYRLIATRMAGRPVTNIAPDPFTYGCGFGADLMMLWGAPRSVTLAPGLRVIGAEGQALGGQDFTLSEDTPLIISADHPIRLGRDVVLGAQRVVADSYDQFAFPGIAGQPQDPFARSAVIDGHEVAMETHPGQDRQGAPWTPYLGVPGTSFARLEADRILPGRHSGAPVEILHRYTAPQAEDLTLRVHLVPSAANHAGVQLRVSVGGKVLLDRAVTAALDQSLSLPKMGAGQVLTIAVGPVAGSGGGAADYRFTLLRPQG